jgi:hypothetical protein
MPRLAGGESGMNGHPQAFAATVREVHRSKTPLQRSGSAADPLRDGPAVDEVWLGLRSEDVRHAPADDH